MELIEIVVGLVDRLCALNPAENDPLITLLVIINLDSTFLFLFLFIIFEIFIDQKCMISNMKRKFLGEIMIIPDRRYVLIGKRIFQIFKNIYNLKL